MSRPLSLVLLLGLAGLLGACGTEQIATQPVIAVAAPIDDGSLMTPGRPQLSNLPEQVAAKTLQPVTWNMWWGENGERWTLYVNGVKAGSGKLPSATPKAQQGTANITMDRPGTYEIKVALCNDHGCSESEPAQVSVSAG